MPSGNVNSYGRPAALTAKEMQREMLLQMMMTGEEAPPPPEPVQDMRKGMGSRPGEGSSPAAGATQLRFTVDSVDRYHLCGCSPYALLIGTSSAMLPPLDRDGYRKQRSDDLKEAWSALPQEEKDAYGFELELLQFLTKLVGNMDQKITDKKAAQLLVPEWAALVDEVSGFVYKPDEVRYLVITPKSPLDSSISRTRSPSAASTPNPNPNPDPNLNSSPGLDPNPNPHQVSERGLEEKRAEKHHLAWVAIRAALADMEMALTVRPRSLP